jgi:hypothetical protein
MITKYLTLIAFLYTLNLNAQISYRFNPPPPLDLGNIYFDSSKITEFYHFSSDPKIIWLVNTGKQPIRITNMNWGQDFCPVTYYKDPIKSGDSISIEIFCTAFGYERPFKKGFYLTIEGVPVVYEFLGKFVKMPHITEVDTHKHSLTKNDSSDIKPNDTITFNITLKNLSDTISRVLVKHYNPFFKLDTTNLLIPPHQSLKIPVIFKAPQIEVTTDYRYILEPIQMKVINREYEEKITVHIDGFVHNPNYLEPVLIEKKRRSSVKRMKNNR